MFLSLRNLNKRLTRFTLKNMKSPKSVKTSPFSDSPLSGEKKGKEFINEKSVSKYFDEHEQYIANFYKKHKDSILFREYHDQNFENFLSAIESVMKKQNRNEQNVKKYIADMNKVAVQSREPLREVLIYYQMFVNTKGFDPVVLSETLLFLGRLYKSRENFHRVYSDFTHWDFINSYRVYHIIEDLKFAITNDNSFFSGQDMAKAIKGLTLAGYKNTKVVDLVFERIEHLLLGTPLNKTHGNFADTPGAGKSKYNATNKWAEDIFYQKDFRQHVWKLMQMNYVEEEGTTTGEDKDSSQKLKSHDSKKEKFEEEMMEPIRDIIKLLRETKEIQHHLTDTIDNLLDQYYKIEQAFSEHDDISNNPYIKYELFKLQDRLVEGGYLTIEALRSINNKQLSKEEFEKVKVKNIISVLRDFVLINFPHLYTPGENKLDSLLEADESSELHIHSAKYTIDALSLGKVLSELSDYCKITDIDINAEDYCNEKIVKEYVPVDLIENKNREQILIKPEYTKLYYNTEHFFIKIADLVETKVVDCKDLAALGYIYYAYANMNIASCQKLKSVILSKMKSLAMSSKLMTMSNTDIQYIICGLAEGGVSGLSTENNARDIANTVATKINVNELYSSDDMIKLLWGLCGFKLYTNEKFTQILIKLSENADNLVNYLSHMKDFNMYLYQLSVCLYHEVKDAGVTIPSALEFLADLHLNQRDFLGTKFFYGKMYPEIASAPKEMLIDPVKNTLMNGMKEGMFSKEIQKRFTSALTQFETRDSPGRLPFFPDLVFGFYGHKIALFVLGKDFITDDSDVSNIPTNGWCNITRRVLLEKFNTHAVFIPTSQLIKFDLNSVSMDLIYSDAGFTHYLDNIIAKQLNISLEKSALFQIDKYLGSFVKKFAHSEKADVIFNTETSKENLEDFMGSLMSIIDLHSDLVYVNQLPLLKNKITDLTVNIEKSKLYFDVMSDSFKLYVNDIIKEITGADINYAIFTSRFVENYKTFVNKVVQNNNDNLKENLVISDNWLGKRLYVDLIPDEMLSLKEKNISAEFINNNFMWIGEYCPYEDWEEELKSSFDSFNYFVENSKNKFLFNSHKLGHRNVPEGVFPHPNKLRKIKSPLIEKDIQAGSSYEYELKNYQNRNEILIKEEVSKNSKVEKADSQLSMKVNLLNINNSLKQNLNDNQIIKFISNFEFVDQLIDEHFKEVNNSSDQSESQNITQTALLKRDPQVFLNFYKKLAEANQQYDEYDKFIMKEYYNQQKLFDLDPNLSPEENQKSIEQRMAKKVEENEDNDAISVYNPNVFDYKFDIKSVLSAGRVVEIDADCEKSAYKSSPELFVYRKRLFAERNIILFKILTKLCTSDGVLNEKEEKYLKWFVESVSKCNLNNISDVGVGRTITSLRFGDLSPNDNYALNSLYNVDINEQSSHCSLSELILEFSHFIDSTTLNKVIHQIYEANHKELSSVQNNTANTTSVFNSENKEQKLITQELKENIWRLSGLFNEDDKAKMKKMLRVRRGKSKFDKVWLEIDEKSFEDFLKSANLHEDRTKYLAKWVKRKEREYENRLELPPDNLRLSDTQINSLIEKKDKAYRKTVLFNIFQVDDISKVDSKRLSDFINEFCSSLYLFNFNYPQTIKDIFNALEDVPSMYEEDRQLLKSFRLFFNIDEGNPFEFLSCQPIKMTSEKFQGKEINSVEELLSPELFSRIEKAAVPFIPEIVNKISKISK